MLEVGTHAPAFTLPDQKGNLVSLADFAGKKVILYFYPKDNTPGCTRQACGFAQHYGEFQSKDVVVIGISKDSVASHLKFAQKYELPFVLLSDPELQAIQSYDVWPIADINAEKQNVCMDKKSFSLKTQSYIANAIYIAVAFIINANNNSNFVLFLSITFYPITIQTLTIMIIVYIVKSVYGSTTYCNFYSLLKYIPRASLVRAPCGVFCCYTAPDIPPASG